MERISYSKEKIENMSNEELLATLDDVVQMNLLKVDNVEWVTLKKPTYHMLMNELAKRL